MSEPRIIETCPKCGGRVYEDSSEPPRDALCFKCANCSWIYFISDERYKFVPFDPSRHIKNTKKST